MEEILDRQQAHALYLLAVVRSRALDMDVVSEIHLVHKFGG